MNETPVFRIEAEGYCVLLRLLLGFVSVMLGEFDCFRDGFIVWAGLALVFCVWFDAVTGWYFRRHGPKISSTVALETYADAVCFVAAPIEFVVVLAQSAWPLLMLPVFLLASIYRLARFQIQGVVKGGYVGLPVTYNGYLFPLAGVAIHFTREWADIILLGLLLVVSAAMTSSRFTVPEF